MNADQLKAAIKVCMFDQYGTVVDMQGGLVEMATPYLAKKGWAGSPNSFVTWWRRTHYENSMIDALLHREHTPYREIGDSRPCVNCCQGRRQPSDANRQLRSNDSLLICLKDGDRRAPKKQWL